MSDVLIPDFQDEVKSKLNETRGTVIAVYVKNGIRYLDVRVENRVYYESPSDNWSVAVKCVP